ncbi:MAG: class II aldolase/adducin family protein [Dongiaceae bacterium]
MRCALIFLLILLAFPALAQQPSCAPLDQAEAYKVAYDDLYNCLVFDEAEGDRMAGVPGPEACVLFLAHHGVIVIGRTVGECFHRLYFLERACMVQFIAMSSGRPLRLVSDKDAEKAVREFDRRDAHAAESHFAALRGSPPQ